MERNDNIIWWKKVGGGSLRLNGKMIKPNEKFKASVEQIPKAFRDVVIPLEKIEEIQSSILPENEPKYSLTPLSRKGFYNIVNIDGKKLNEKPLKEVDAWALLKDLGVNTDALKQKMEDEAKVKEEIEEEVKTEE
jgi:hypothetical protein